jgi:urease accessory protein
MPHRSLPLLLAALLLAPGLAHAHIGPGVGGGLVHGFAHPLGGLDHLLAMIAVGFWAAQAGGRARWALPLAFVLVMALGGVIGMAAFVGPVVEYGIAGSVVALGALVALAARLPVLAGVLLIGVFGFLHGHAHGLEMPQGAGPLAYGLGFVLATGLLHGAGLALGTLAGDARGRLPRTAGACVAAIGVVMLATL